MMHVKPTDEDRREESKRMIHQDDRTKAQHQQPTPPSISSRAGIAIDWHVTSTPTQTQRDAYRNAGEKFVEVLAELRTLIETDLKQLEDKLEKAGAPWTPGRIPEWGLRTHAPPAGHPGVLAGAH